MLVADTLTVNSLQMDIMLVVRVPVLSEQMTEVQPRVSTDGRDLTIAFWTNIIIYPSLRDASCFVGAYDQWLLTKQL